MNPKVLCTMGIFILLILSVSTDSFFNTNEDFVRDMESNISVIHDSREPIRINGDNDFADQAAAEGWPGDGSEDDPYVIDGYEINGTGKGCGIYIGNTTVHFVVRNNYVHNASGRANMYFRNTGLFLYNVTNGRADNNVIKDCSHGVRLDQNSLNNTIYNNTVSNNTEYGIFLYRSSLNTFIYNHVFNNTRGFYVLHHSHENVVSDNLIEHNTQNGVLMQLSTNNTFSDNVISSNIRGGIYISNSQHIQLYNNDISSNARRGIYVLNSVYIELFENAMVNNGINIFGGSPEHWNTHTISTDNTVNGRPVHYWKDVTGGTVSTGAGQIILANCTGVTVENQHISDTDIGIILGYSNDNILSNNIVFSNFYGISVSHSEGNTILDNHVYNNSRGFYIYYGDDNYLSQNIVEKNDFGFHVHSSTDTTLDNNLISDNDYGMYLFRSIRVTLEGNEIIGHGILMGGEKVEYWNTHVIDTSNTANGNPIHYWKDQRSGTVPPDAGQVILANCSQVIVHGQKIGYDIVGIQLGFSFSNIISNNTASYNQRGIYLYNSYENTLSDNILYNNTHGIYMLDSNKNSLPENEMHNNTYGIYMSNSDNNNASANTLGNNSYGIYIYRSASSTLHNNDMLNDGIMINGNLFRHWDTHDISYSNTVNGSPVYYWKNKTEGTVPPGAGQVILANCMDVVVEGQNLIGATAGIQMGYSVENTISDNNIINNKHGIYLYASSDNMIYHNNFLNNEDQAYEEGMNQWDDDYPNGGNYWSDYEELYPDASEIDDSGIWDTAYAIPGVGNFDRFPLKQPKGALGLTIEQPEPGGIITEESVTVNWSSTGGLGVREHRIRLEGEDWIGLGSETEYTFHYIEDGNYRIEVELADGILDEVIKDVNFIVDTTPPVLDIISPYHGEIFDTGSLNIRWEGSDASTGISHYEIRLTGEDWVDAGTDTTYSYSELTDGYHRAEVRAWDIAGYNTTQCVNFTVDTTPPVLNIITPFNGEIFGGDNLTVEWEGSDATTEITRYEIRLAGGGWVDAGTDTTYSYSELTDGLYRTEVRAWDSAGHVSTVGVKFVVDTLPPLVEITSPPHGEIFRSNVIMAEWSGYDETSGISHYEIRINEDDWIEVGSSTHHLLMDLPEGEHTLRVRAWDNASHASTDSVTFNIASMEEDDDDVGLLLMIFVAVATFIIFTALVFLLWKSRKRPKEHYEHRWYEKESKRSWRHDHED